MRIFPAFSSRESSVVGWISHQTLWLKDFRQASQRSQIKFLQNFEADADKLVQKNCYEAFI